MDELREGAVKEKDIRIGYVLEKWMPMLKLSKLLDKGANFRFFKARLILLARAAAHSP
jgi:hypothetical protein